MENIFNSALIVSGAILVNGGLVSGSEDVPILGFALMICGIVSHIVGKIRNKTGK